MKASNIITAALITLAAISATPAQAATAFLQSCETGTSVTGRFIYIGTYDYAGQLFQRTFTSYCPQSITVY